MLYVGLGALGLLIGAFGTLIGAGGGFLLVPMLVLLYPHEKPSTIASISLAVVLCNTASGTIAYLRQHRVDVRSGVRFSLAAVPGAILGAVVVDQMSRAVFELVLGLVLMGVAIFLLASKRPPKEHDVAESPDLLGPHFAQRRWVGVGLSFIVGFLSSLLGIGGGIIHVTALVHVLDFPVHVATATSHFVLATTAAAGTATHIASGVFATGWRRAIALGIGAIIGAQIGAMLARRMKSTVILRALAVALLLVGGRIVLRAVVG